MSQTTQTQAVEATSDDQVPQPLREWADEECRDVVLLRSGVGDSHFVIEADDISFTWLPDGFGAGRAEAPIETDAEVRAHIHRR